MTSKVIAITGGIGSGKSEVSRYLRSLGYQTVDCDALAKEVSAQPCIIRKVQNLLGKEYISDGRLNRKAIREKVFADKDILQKYNEIFFFEVKKILLERLSQLDGTVFVEIPVFDAFLFEWNGVWLVEADEDIRLNRACARDNSSSKTMRNILRSQHICQDYSVKIINNGSIENLKKQVDEALKSIR